MFSCKKSSYILAKIASRSSNFLDHYSNITSTNNYQANANNDVPKTQSTQTQPDYNSNSNSAKGQWVWHPAGEDKNYVYYKSGNYYQQEAQPRQGFLALLNPSTLVSNRE